MSIRDIPDPAELGFRAPKWQKALTEHRMLRRKHTAALAEHGHLRRKLTQAAEEDTYAHARAIRSGKSDPGTPATDAVKGEQATVQRQVDALSVAVAESQRELMAAVEAEKESLLAELDATVEGRRAALVAAVDAWNEARMEHAEAIAFRQYLTTFPEGRFKPGAGYLRNQPRAGDGRGALPMDQILTMLRDDAAEPQARPQPANLQPLQPTVREIGVSGTPNMEPISRR